MVIALRNLLFSVVQVPKLLEVFSVFIIPIAITMVRLTSSLGILPPLPLLLVIDEGPGSTPIPMLHRANDEAIAREFGA
jgi:hypothetical protein